MNGWVRVGGWERVSEQNKQQFRALVCFASD